MDDDVIELRGSILALTVFIANLVETLMQSGYLTYDQVTTICHHSDLRISYMCHELQNDTPDVAIKRIERQATDLILKLMNDVKPRR